MNPLPLAEKEKIHNVVRQDLKENSRSQENELSSYLEMQKQKKPMDSDFLTTRKACSFVNKYYKNSTQIRGY